MFRPQGVWITAVSSSMCINLNSPSHDLLADRYTSTYKPVGSLCNNADDFFDFWRPFHFQSKGVLLCAYSICIYVMELSTRPVLSICVGVVVILAGRFVSPKTSNAVQSPSGPTVQFIANTETCNHSWSVLLLSVSVLMRSYASLTDRNIVPRLRFRWPFWWVPRLAVHHVPPEAPSFLSSSKLYHDGRPRCRVSNVNKRP